MGQLKVNQDLKQQVGMILGSEGLAVQEGLTFNQQQFDYALLITDLLLESNQAGQLPALNPHTALGAAQGSTGTGKTLAYLVPHLLHIAATGGRVIVSTFTKNLQKQILSGDGPKAIRWVEQITGKRLTVAMRMGQGNLVSEQAIDHLEAAFQDQSEIASATGGLLSTTQVEQAAFVKRLKEWLVQQTSSGQYAILDDYLEQVEPMPPHMDRTFLTMRRGQRSVNDMQRYMNMVADSKAADLLIVNHALSVIHAYRFSKVLDDEQKPADHFIFDEADRLPAVAEQIMSESISIVGVLYNMRELHRQGVLQDALSIEILEQFVAILRTHPDCGKGAAPLDHYPELGAIIKNLAKHIEQVAVETKKRSRQILGVDDQSTSLLMLEFEENAQELVRIATQIEKNTGRVIISWSPVRSLPSLLIGDTHAGQVMGCLWRRPEEPAKDQPESFF